ncbi:MAG: nuclear transport factor 2 family protein [Nitrosomonadales bacterium]
MIFTRPPLGGMNRRYLVGYLAMILLVAGAGWLVVLITRPAGNIPGAVPVQSENVTPPLHDSAPPKVQEAQADVKQTRIAAKPQQSAQAEIHKMLAQWAEAWSRRDAVAYLAYYAPDFSLPEGMQRTVWEAQRQLRLRQYRSIRVALKDVKISYTGGDTASVRFTQDFRADGFKELGTLKELYLKNIQGKWLIVSEKNA